MTSDPAQAYDLDRSTCLALVGSRRVGRLVLGGDEPVVVPVNFTVHEEGLVLRTAHDARAVQRVGTTVVFEVDDVDETHHTGWSVVIRGHLDDATVAVAIDEDLNERLEPWAPGDKDRWLLVRIAEVSGRWVRGRDDRPPLDGRAYL
jgi:nitroimidazol reductase NimA-like FMN-containing flavoprotein (pyridoxamine 5'-phosphate oxidase superfamily)